MRSRTVLFSRWVMVIVGIVSCSSVQTKGLLNQSVEPVSGSSTEQQSLTFTAEEKNFSTTTVPFVGIDIQATPLGFCEEITGGAVGFRNRSGREPNDVFIIGRSVENRDLVVEHWGQSDGPQILIIGQVHGNECSPALIVDAVRRYPPSTFGIWLIPTLNPDGMVNGSRFNADGVDLNDDGFTQWAPETQALMRFTSMMKPALSIHLHSPLNWIGYFNDWFAEYVARSLVDALEQSITFTAGTRKNRNEFFLWQGQQRELPGHGSILIELPAISTEEANGAPKRESKLLSDIPRVERMAKIFMDTLTKVMSPGN